MLAWLLIPAGILVISKLLKGGSDKLPPAAPLPLSGKVQVGDIVTVALVSAEPVPFPDHLPTKADENNPALMAEMMSKLTSIAPADQAIFDKLDKLAESGGTAKFRVTATGLLPTVGSLSSDSALGGPVPTSIGLMIDPALSVNFPFGFMTASVQRIERNGQVVLG
jgi:hypothetical protein